MAGHFSFVKTVIFLDSYYIPGPGQHSLCTVSFYFNPHNSPLRKILFHFINKETKDQRLKELAGSHSVSREQTQDSTWHPRGQFLPGGGLGGGEGQQQCIRAVVLKMWFLDQQEHQHHLGINYKSDFLGSPQTSWMEIITSWGHYNKPHRRFWYSCLRPTLPKGLVLASRWQASTVCHLLHYLWGSLICKSLPIDCLPWHGSMHLLNQRLLCFLV